MSSNPSSTTTAAQPGKYEKPLLAWWGILPVLIYAAIQAKYGWPEAKVRATGSAFVVSYFIGGLIAGPLISLVPAVIGYWVFRRSRLVATILFSLMMGLCCLSAMAQFRPSPNAGSAKQHAIPLLGVSVGSPPGWRELPRDRVGIVTRWVSPDFKPQDGGGTIQIEMMKPDIEDAGRIARDLAKQWGGRVADGPATLDGETAWRVLAEPSKPGLQPVESLVTIHDGRLYLIMGGVSPGHTCHDQIESIRQSWKWIPLDPPVKHLEFQDQPSVVFNGRISINYPAAMFVFDHEYPDRRVGIGLTNFERDRKDFTAVVQFLELPNGDTLSKAKDQLATGTQAKFHLPEAFAWHDIGGDPKKMITQAVPGPEADGRNWIMWGVVGLANNQMILINFAIYDEDPTNRATYAKVAEKIVESVVAVHQ